MRFLNNLKWPLVALVLMFTQNIAQASILIEPHLAYNLSSSGTQGSTKYEYSGTQYGGRVGYQNLGLMYGLDLTASSFTFKSSGGLNSSNETTRTQIGLFAGYNFPILLRAWATYFVSDTFKFASGNELSGSCLELGAGFTGIPFLSINGMVRLVSLTSGKIGSTTGTLTQSLSLTEVVVGVSIPLTL